MFTTRPHAVLRGFRRRAEMSRSVLAKAVSVSVDQIEAWEDGSERIVYEDAKKLATVFEADPIYFTLRRSFNQHELKLFARSFRHHLAEFQNEGLTLTKQDKVYFWSYGYMSGLGPEDFEVLLADFKAELRSRE